MNLSITPGQRLAPPPTPEPGSPRPPKRRERRPRGFLLRWLGRLVGALAGLALLAAVVATVGIYAAYRHYAADLPDFEGLKHYQPRLMSRVYAADGTLLTDLSTERRIFVPINAIPQQVKSAFVSAEDRNFWTHPGVDPMAIVRAAVTDLAHLHEGRRPLGASTITQQVAKNMLLSGELTLARKIREAILAMRIERSLSKERILELYLNQIYLGQGAYGVAAAAQTYFNKPLAELSLSEAAMLAALPKAPNIYNPFRNPEAARTRRDWVLDRMAEDRVITPAEAEAAKATPVHVAPLHRPDAVPGAEYFAEDVRRELIARFGFDVATQGGLMVRTSLDPRLQRLADRALRNGLMAYDRSHGGWRGPVAHMEDANLARNWVSRLAQFPPQPGMLPQWRLAVVLEVADASAKLGWLEPSADGAASGAPTPRTGVVLLAETRWARPVHDHILGPTPRRMRDVLAVGDVVMVEPEGARPARGKSPPVPERLALRQIPEVQGALVSLDPRTGRVLALSGGWSAELSQFDRATQANRQPGSSFKPFVYLTAMEKGISPSQRFLDAPFVVDLANGEKWRPNNYEMDFEGPISLHEALRKSRNLVTLRVANRVGMEAIAETAKAFHVVESMPLVLPAALGAVETTVLRMAGAYAGLDEGGREVVPTLIDSVQDPQGRVIWRAQPVSCGNCTPDPSVLPELTDQRAQIADPASVFQVVTMMEDVVRRGTGVAAGQGIDRPIAGKTGTTQDFNDAWFGGFTPDLVTVVWVGYDQPASLGDRETGGALAAPIWHDFMAEALRDRPVLDFTPPPGVTLAQWNGEEGLVTDAFKPGQEPGVSAPLDAPQLVSEPTEGAPATAEASEANGSGNAASPHPAAGSSGVGGLDAGLGGLY
ncbi:MAG: penicillin-binding protein 1A [Acidobacteriia bacterium]|nr:penicillin-binding protein 1A [Methyloceanibacter sp.]MCL6492008.1 penicillin-binding protein 1A [Terriglobia bacterium]